MPNPNLPASRMSDSRWEVAMVRCRDGSEESWGELLESCRQYLLLVANQELDKTLTAKAGGSDMVQETLLSAQCQFAGFSGKTRDDLLRWLRCILLNHLSDLNRRYLIAEKRLVHREVSLHSGKFLGKDENPVSKVRSPSSHAIGQENTLIVKQALQGLPRQYYRVIFLRHQERLSFNDVAEQLDITSESARKLWARALERLRKELSTKMKLS